VRFNVGKYNSLWEKHKGVGGTHDLCSRCKHVHLPDLGWGDRFPPFGIKSYLTKLVNYFKSCVLTVQIIVLCAS